MRVSGKLAIGFSVALIVAVILGLMGITGMREMRESVVFMYENRVRGIEFVQDAQNHFNEMRVQGRNTIINGFYDDKKGALDSLAAFEFHAEEFLVCLDNGRDIADSEELLMFYDRIQELFTGSYLPVARIIHDRTISDIPDHHNKLYINTQIAAASVTAIQIENLLRGLLELNSALARQTGIDNTWLTQQYAILLYSLIFPAIVVIFIVAYFIIRSVSVPIKESAGVLTEIAQGNFEARVKGNYKDEFKIIKTSINNTAQQLADYLDEKMRVERAGKELLAAANRAANILLLAGGDETFEDSIIRGIEAVGSYMDADCIELWKNEITANDRLAVKWKYWYSESGNKLKTVVATDFSYDDHPSFYDSMLRNEVIEGPVSNLSQEYQDLFGRFGIKSILNIPLFIADRYWGFFCVLDFHSFRNYSDEEIEILRTTFLMIVNAINRYAQDIELKENEIAAHKAELEKTKVEAVANAMRESITYASKIQRNLLPPDDIMAAAFSDYSVIWKPRDIVGGDVYWVRLLDAGTMLCICDCTGHGTPGALLTMLVVSALENISSMYNCSDTAEIVWRLDRRLSTALHVDSGAGTQHGIMNIFDGCDIAVLFVAKDGSVQFSSGKIPVFVCDGNDVIQYKGQKISVGEGKLKSKDEVIVHSIPKNPDNKFYVASDGLFDQVGGEHGMQFGYKTFKQIILDNHTENQAVITDKIWDAFEQYRGEQARRDDFELVAFKPFLWSATNP